MRITTVRFNGEGSTRGPVATALVEMTGDFAGMRLFLSVWRSKTDANDYQVSMPGSRFQSAIGVSPIYKEVPVVGEGNIVVGSERCPIEGSQDATGHATQSALLLAVKAAYLEHTKTLGATAENEYTIQF